MAQPIGATPILTGNDAARFIKRISKNAKKPVDLVPTPKLAEAEELIKKLSVNEQKHIQ